jgi:hypothetical protein
MNTFRIDVGELYYLLLDAPTRAKAWRWVFREMPESPEIISIRRATTDERLDYDRRGFYVRQLSDTMGIEANDL